MFKPLLAIAAALISTALVVPTVSQAGPIPTQALVV